MKSDSTTRIAVVVMAKAPFPGEAKTRLGATLGLADAAALGEAFLRDTLTAVEVQCTPLGLAETFVVCPDARHAAGLAPLVGATWQVRAQSRPGLMGGIVDGFTLAFAAGAELALIFDADSPLALREHLGRCVAMGFGCELGLGPTADGGYYLISARRTALDRLPELLLGAPYDGATICAATQARARSLGLRVGFAPDGFDVDTQEDLDALRVKIETLPVDWLPATRAALARLDREPMAAGREHS